MGMKVNYSTFTNPYNITFGISKKSNLSFSGNSDSVSANSEGDKYISTDIYDKTYRFKVNDETKDAETLNKMIENIKKTLTGYFVRYNTNEYFIPYVLSDFPDILRHRHAVENGNAAIEINEETEKAISVFQSQIKGMLNLKDLKSIKYLRTPEAGYANNVVKTAYSYFDKMNNDLYLYLPQKQKLKVLTSCGLVKKIKL